MIRVRLGRACWGAAAACLLLAGCLAGGAPSALAAGPVSVAATWVVDVTTTSARLHAEVNPNGLPGSYRFEYGTSTAYGASVPVPDAALGAGSVDVTVGNLVQGLAPSTTYHYRVVANSEAGVVEGPDRTFTTQGTGSGLPDGRVWEQVSPANKHGAPLEPLTEQGGLIQAAAGGGAFAYVALGPPNTDPHGLRSPEDTQLLATRGSDGWHTQDITTPHEEISKIFPGFPSEYAYFAEDLSAAIVAPVGDTPLSPLATERTAYRREADGVFVPLVTAANAPAETKFGGNEVAGTGLWEEGAEFVSATPDLKHVVLHSPQALAPGFKHGFTPAGNQSLYVLADGHMQLASVLPNEQPAAEAGLTVKLGRALNQTENMREAISRDGKRVFFSTLTRPGRLYMRDLSLDHTLRIDEPGPGVPGGPESVGAEFQGASSDGSRVFFSDDARLTSTSTATASPSRPDLYMCEVNADAEGHLSCALTDLSVDPHAGEAANLPAESTVSALDETGEHVYFAANGVLTDTPDEHGEHALPGDCSEEHKLESTCNLYAVDTVTHQLRLVAVLSSRDVPDWERLTELTARTSPDGRYFAFMSRRSLTGYDNRDALSGQPDEEVFLYDSSTGALRCASCNATGERPHGLLDSGGFPGLLVDHIKTWEGQSLAASVPGWTAQREAFALYQSRYLSNTGRLFFNSPDALVPQDTNGLEDVYEYEPPGVGSCTESSPTYSSVSGGCVGLISSGTSTEESAFLDASETGDEVFFLTSARLARSDIDSAFDVYDAHVCTASSPCPAPGEASTACEGDSCQSPGPAPGDQTPASLTYTGPGNLPPALARAKAKAKPPTRAQLLARALKACRVKHDRRKRTACERAARRRYPAGKAANAKRPGGRS